MCYYDGLPMDDAPLNLIHVPRNAFSEFFTATTMPLPTKIVCFSNCSEQAKADIETTFSQMLEEIEAARHKQKQNYDGYPHYKDSYFLDPKIAYHTAVQQNRVTPYGLWHR